VIPDPLSLVLNNNIGRIDLSKIADCLLKAFSAACSFTLCIDPFTMQWVFQEHLISFLPKYLLEVIKVRSAFLSFFNDVFAGCKKSCLIFSNARCMR
jgi:hypothetical protein